MNHFWLFTILLLFCTVNLAFATQESPTSNSKPDFPESIKIGDKVPFSLKISNLEEYIISDIEPIITIMPKSANDFVHVEFHSQISTLWEGFYDIARGTIYIDKDIAVDRIFVSVSFMGKNQHGEQVSLSDTSTFNASIKIEKSQKDDIANDSTTDYHKKEKQETYYVKYKLSKDEHFALPAFVKKRPLPSETKQSMLDWCVDSSSSVKNDPQFWDVMPIRILSTTAEFQSLKGKTDSFVVNSHAAEESCPPNVWMTGTFISENGEKHKFSLYHDADFFRYNIGEIKCKEGLELVYKKAHDTPTCVKISTMIELVIRGWAEDNRIILGCFGDRVEKCYPSDTNEYRKALYEYYFGKNDDLPSDNFTKLQTINACTEHQICLGELDNGTKIRVSCDYPVHGCGVVPFDELTMPDDFGLVYSFGVGGKNVLDTKKMSYTADMVCEPQIEIKLKLSHDEIYQIWDLAHKNDFFALNDFTDNCDAFGNCKLVTPEQQTTITITEGGKTHSVTHRDSYISKSNDGYAKFQKIANTIQEILDKRIEIQSLPQLKCGYQ